MSADATLEWLAKAIAAEPGAAAMARDDRDFDPIRVHARFRELTEPAGKPAADAA